MGVSDGQAVNAAVTNAAFIDATADDTATGKLTLGNVEAVSGSSVTNVQREHNSIASFVGKSLNSAKDNVPTYTNNQGLTSNDPLLDRIDDLSAKFHSATGHTHSGSAGDGGPLDFSPLTTKGDLYTYDTDNARLPVGTNGQVLTADSAETTGIKWVTPASGGISQLTGDVTAGPGSGSQAATIASSAVTNAKMANMADGTIKSNISGGAAAPSDNALTAILDDAFSSTQGSILYRGAGAWAALGPGTSGEVLTTNGAAADPTWDPASGGGFSPSEIWLQGVGGTPYGSVGTKRPRFANTPIKSVGTDVTYTDSSNDGTILTINTTGIYHVKYTSAFSGSAADMGLTLNNTQGSTNIGSVTAADVLDLFTTAGSAFSGIAEACSNFTAGDTISPQTDGTTISSAARSVTLRITRVG